MADMLSGLPPGAFRKIDPEDDSAFYATPRLVTHIDAAAIAALEAFYRAVLPRDGVILDLMSSFVSHLPPKVPFRSVVGHGMNAEELGANPRLDRWFVADLNRQPRLPLEDGAFDAALCCVGVQYLERPLAVFEEVRRVLAPGAPFVVSFSNRCFPTKAMAIWRALDGRGHATLVRVYFEGAGFSDVDCHVLADGSAGDPLTVVVGRAPGGA